MRFILIVLISLAVVGCQPSTHDSLVEQCIDANAAEGRCMVDGYFTSQTVIDRCNQRMAIVLNTPGCAELEQEYMSCGTDFFANIAQPQDCRPPSPSYRIWLSLNTYCMDVQTRMTTNHCPDPW